MIGLLVVVFAVVPGLIFILVRERAQMLQTAEGLSRDRDRASLLRAYSYARLSGQVDLLVFAWSRPATDNAPLRDCGELIAADIERTMQQIPLRAHELDAASWSRWKLLLAQARRLTGSDSVPSPANF